MEENRTRVSSIRRKAKEEEKSKEEKISESTKQWLEQELEITFGDRPLQEVLMNGILLCKLIQKHEPALLPKWNDNEKMKYKMFENM
jgi:hypothetical protein